MSGTERLHMHHSWGELIVTAVEAPINVASKVRPRRCSAAAACGLPRRAKRCKKLRRGRGHQAAHAWTCTSQDEHCNGNNTCADSRAKSHLCPCGTCQVGGKPKAKRLRKLPAQDCDSVSAVSNVGAPDRDSTNICSSFDGASHCNLPTPDPTM